MIKPVLNLLRYFSSHKGFLWGILVLLVALLLLASLRIHFKEDISGFLPQDHNTERINYAYQHVGAANKLIVSFLMADAMADPELDMLTAAIDSFADRITARDTTGYIRRMTFRVEQQQMQEISRYIVTNMPYFLTESDYERMDSLVEDRCLYRQLDEGKRLLSSPVGAAFKQNFIADPLHISAPLLSRLRSFQADSHYSTYEDYIFTKDRRKGIITIESTFPANETGNNTRLIELIDHTARDIEHLFDNKLKIKHFGATDIALGNAQQIKKDSIISGWLALVLIFALLLYVFRSFRIIIIIFVSLVFGWLFAFGLLAVFKTEVDLIAVGIASIIMGIAVNYPLHLLDHYRHERDMKTVIKHIVAPLLIGNITTVGAFLSLMFINSAAMRDLGLFASLLLVGTILFVLIFVPHLRLPVSRKENLPTVGNKRIFSPERNKWVVWAVMLLSVFFCWFSFDTKFENNMQTINYMNDEQRADFAEMLASLNSDGETVYFVSEGRTADEALRAHERAMPRLDSLLRTGDILRINGIDNFLPSKEMQKQRIQRWLTFWEKHSATVAQLERYSAELGFRAGTFAGFVNLTQQKFDIQEFDYFSPVTENLASHYIVHEPERFMVMNILHTQKSTVNICEDIFVDFEECYFAFDAGTMSRKIISALSDNFNTVLYICGVIVFVFLFFTLGRAELSLLAFLPLMVGWFWILGIMNLCDIRFNIVNIILATLIFGQGDDYSIFITEGLMYEYAYGKKLLASYKNSIALSALIMFIGIGSLIIAKHPALHSLAQVTIIGMLSVVLMTFIFPPLVFRRLTMVNGVKRRMPVTFIHFFSTVYAFVVFLFCSMFITLVGFLLFTVGRETEKNKLRYHRILYRISGWVMRHFPQARMICDIPQDETFEKPAVMICNHQSHVDLMCVLMLHPKIIVLTNDWVWNSPFYGRLIKYADFYPVSNGMEKAIDKLKSAVERGYSIMIFPEGTRSEDCSIQRFHKGAFYLAEQLQIDLLPVMIHGIGHILPKKEFMLRKGTIHVRVMNRIIPQDMRFGNTYVERAKGVGKLYREQYAQLSSEVETADYYCDMVYHNYLYKGPSIAKAVSAGLKREHLSAIIAKLAKYKYILVKNCGYGEFSLLLALVCKQTAVTATDPNEDCLSVAANCAAVPKNLCYTAAVGQEDGFDKIIDLKNLKFI
ncbi:MAG: 1-acyl-sn-glycerol-3-phosphate acyltransferase [Bacteroidales bacterium]|jgi:1-acyl-sn-glycerol-3-phosphate acyltransferase|nr:1-acyl-sn-glycerol-3-phosphate acyltransferase [Bacteroidales bacterium]